MYGGGAALQAILNSPGDKVVVITPPMFLQSTQLDLYNILGQVPYLSFNPIFPPTGGNGTLKVTTEYTIGTLSV